MPGRRLISMWAAACLYAAQAQSKVAGPPFTVSELVTQALERNRDLLAARQRLAEAQGLLRQAGVWRAPTTEVQAETGSPLATPRKNLGNSRGTAVSLSRTGLCFHLWLPALEQAYERNY